jgi:hypothetical protein
VQLEVRATSLRQVAERELAHGRSEGVAYRHPHSIAAAANRPGDGAPGELRVPRLVGGDAGQHLSHRGVAR